MNLQLTDNKTHLINTAKLCPYCGDRPRLISSTEIYGTDYGMMWECSCGAYVGCHPGTNKPLGRVADKELRRWKNLAHDVFDALWKRRAKVYGGKRRHYCDARTKAYEWLSQEMGIEKKYTHIGMFDIDQCKKVVELCKPYLELFTKPTN